MDDSLYRNDDVVGFFAKRYLVNPNLLEVRFEITRNCNFDCHYCRDHIFNFPHPSYEMLKQMMDFLINMDNKVFYLNLIGGEPTTHPDLFRIIEYFLKNINSDRLRQTTICLSTNFSKPLSYYKEITKLINPYQVGEFKFFPSYHRGSIPLYKFMERYEWALDGDYVSVGAFMLHNKDCVREYNTIKGTEKLRPRPVFGQEHLIGIKEEQESRFDIFNNMKVVKRSNGSFTFEPLAYPFNFNFRKFICYSIKNNITMAFDGTLYYCISRCKENPAGTIFDSNLKQKEFTICPLNNCNCNFGIPKIRMDYFREFKELDIKYIEGL